MIQKTLKERTSGLFLLMLAGLVLGGLTLNSHLAESKKDQNLAQTVESQNEGEILGESDNNSEETVNNSEEVRMDPEENNENDNQEEETQENEEEKDEDKEKNRCEELKRLLKKYCGKNYNVKKCRSYLLETKDLSKKDKECKSLYKKYHFVPKKEDKKDEKSAPANNSEIKEEITFTINYGGGKADDKYTVDFTSGMTVMDIMEKAKSSGLSYDVSAGYVQEINGVREDMPKSIFWMLYSNGAMASEGASTLKIKTGDKIEWRYMEVIW